MKIALLSIFLLFSVNPKVPIEKEHIGSFDVYMNEQDEVEIHYTGNYNKCFTLYLIKKLHSNCEFQIDEARLDSIFQFAPDTIKPIKQPIKITRM